MARPLRINVENGWRHTMSRGIERRTIFLGDDDCRHFLEWVGEMSERYTAEVHGYVLMGNHYHLLLRTPEANASAAMQWLNVSYSAWFNAKEGRVGHVFQGRFHSTLIDGEGSWLLEASAYLHLNPAPVSALGLGKSAKKAESLGLVQPDREMVRERFGVLRGHVWSSYRAYGGYCRGPDWLRMDEILRRAGGAEGYRRFVQGFVRSGMEAEGRDLMRERVAIGSAGFLKSARKFVGRVTIEQPARRFLTERISFERIVEVVEEAKKEPWDSFRSRYGDWGRPLVLYLARKRSGLTLHEIGQEAGGME